MKYISSLILLFFVQYFHAQTKPFYGQLVYKIEHADTQYRKLYPTSYMSIFSNDTIVRVENETQPLGKQITIRHMAFNKSYQLVEVNNKKYAILFDHSKEKADSSVFEIRKKLGRRKLFGHTCKRIRVKLPSQEKPLQFIYFTSFQNKYINNLKNIPGLPVDFYLDSKDGLYHYQLIKFDEFIPNRDLFGIPSDYKRLSFDQFMEELFPAQEIEQEK